MRTIVVLSSQEQVKRLQEHVPDLSDLTIFCDNERCYDYLKSRNIRFQELDEYHIRDKWHEISSWSYGKGAGWIKFCKERELFKTIDFPSVLFHNLSITLMMALKNYQLALYALKESRPQKVIVFDSKEKFSYPSFSGNAFLNYFLSALSSSQKILTERIEIHESIGEAYVDPTPAYRKATLRIIKNMLQWIYSSIARPQKTTQILAFGSLRHLSSVLTALSDRGLSCSVYDNEFHRDQFLFAIKKRIPYIVPQCIPKKHFSELNSFASDITIQTRRALDIAASEGYFLFDSFDLSNFLDEQIFPAMETYIKKLGKEAHHIESIIRSFNHSGLLVEEDFAGRSFFVEFMRSCGIKSFCISHANTTFDFAVSKNDCTFAQSKTFVHSQHEKRAYIDLGWNPEEILITGTPRYDRLICMKRQLMRRSDATIKRILFPGGFLIPYCPNLMGYVGVEPNGFKKVQLETFNTLVEAIRGFPIEIIIKPHHLENEPYWHEHVNNLSPSNVIKITSHADDFGVLLLESDLMVISNWSSTLIEAGICDTPVIYADLTQQNSTSVAEYASNGFCHIAHNLSEMRALIEKLLLSKPPTPRKIVDNDVREFFVGKNDGLGTQRVTDSIVEQMRGYTRIFNACGKRD